MPPLDPASEDKHAPVKPAAARRPAVAPPSATAWRALIIMRASGRPTRVRFAPKADKTLDRSENRDLTGCSKTSTAIRARRERPRCRRATNKGAKDHGRKY
jgi:hypothetical protein